MPIPWLRHETTGVMINGCTRAAMGVMAAGQSRAEQQALEDALKKPEMIQIRKMQTREGIPRRVFGQPEREGRQWRRPSTER